MAKTTSKTEQVKIRRSPKYLTFLISGAILGIIVALILGFSIPSESRTAKPLVTFMVAFLGGGGAALGIIIAVILDRIFVARAKSVEATKLEG
jgi:ABC-type branched-subunit amino acid transport system permease subunit